MKRPLHPEIRALLRQHLDGMTPAEIASKIDRARDADAIRRALENMPDAYIDRWLKTPTSMACWCGDLCNTAYLLV